MGSRLTRLLCLLGPGSGTQHGFERSLQGSHIWGQFWEKLIGLRPITLAPAAMAEALDKTVVMGFRGNFIKAFSTGVIAQPRLMSRARWSTYRRYGGGQPSEPPLLRGPFRRREGELYEAVMMCYCGPNFLVALAALVDSEGEEPEAAVTGVARPSPWAAAASCGLVPPVATAVAPRDRPVAGETEESGLPRAGQARPDHGGEPEAAVTGVARPPPWASASSWGPVPPVATAVGPRDRPWLERRRSRGLRVLVKLGRAMVRGGATIAVAACSVFVAGRRFCCGTGAATS
jgi:hypothetical protein